MTVINNTTKSQQVNVNLLCHDYGADPYSFLVRKCKDVPKSLQLVLHKTKKGRIGIQESHNFFDINEGKSLTADLSNSITNSGTSQNRIRYPLLISFQ
jgi:hypothetical protein